MERTRGWLHFVWRRLGHRMGTDIATSESAEPMRGAPMAAEPMAAELMRAERMEELRARPWRSCAPKRGAARQEKAVALSAPGGAARQKKVLLLLRDKIFIPEKRNAKSTDL